jgi:uncharacterized protein (DUF1778 family)
MVIMDNEYVTVLKLSPEEWAKFIDTLNDPPEPTQALKDLMQHNPIFWDYQT